MNTHEDKAMTLGQAIAICAADGYCISIGGFTINRNPIAAVYEIIWQRKKIFIAVPIQTVPTLMNLLAAGTFWGSKLPISAMGQSALPEPLKKNCGSPLLKLAMKRRRPKTFEFLTRQRVTNIDMHLKTRRGGPKSGTI